MRIKRIQLLIIFSLAALILTSTAYVLAAGISISPSMLGEQNTALTANDLKPPECDGLNLTTIIVCPATGGNCNGNKDNELILGSIYADNIDGKGGDDCILGGDGNDDIDGKGGNDVCIGGGGNDLMTKCEKEYP
jgi:Ca2+-binding RTX toxin-like protein